MAKEKLDCSLIHKIQRNPMVAMHGVILVDFSLITNYFNEPKEHIVTFSKNVLAFTHSTPRSRAFPFLWSFIKFH